MVNISSVVPSTYRQLEEREIVTNRRTYLGMSGIGDLCARKLFLTFRWFAPPLVITPRQQRLFNRGHREEEIFVEELRSINIEVWDVLDEQSELTHCYGHIKGHPDGKGRGFVEAPKTVHLLEFKTMNRKNFLECSKKGSRVSKPVYYVQYNVYMHKEGLDRCMFMAVCKDDDSYLVERHHLDRHCAIMHLDRATRIVETTVAPEKQYKPTWFACKFCDVRMQCHYGRKIDRNCRTCSNSYPINDGKWSCNYLQKTITTEEQVIGCDAYTQLKI